MQTMLIQRWSALSSNSLSICTSWTQSKRLGPHAARSINIDEALIDPENAEIPQEVGHQFATASLLIRRANTENFDNIVKYVERVGDGEFSTPEIGVFVVEAIKRRVPVLAETVTYRDFSLRWADIRA